MPTNRIAVKEMVAYYAMGYYLVLKKNKRLLDAIT